MPSQHIFAGRLHATWQQELGRLTQLHAIERIFARDATLWKPDNAHQKVIRNRLGWLVSLEPMQQEAAQLAQFAQDVQQSGIRDVVLLGMGGSSLAPEVFSLVFPAPPRRRLFVLDSTDPASLRSLERTVNLRETLFVVASKSGKTIETLSQFKYFHSAMAYAGVNPPGKNFLAITDAGSFLEQQAKENHFRRTFINASDIGGRYSALSFFGLLPAALWGIELPPLLQRAAAMKAACTSEGAETNPGLALGALLGAATAVGANKMYLFAAPPLQSLTCWIEQLVAESTGKEGKGVVPVAGEVPGPHGLFEQNAVAVFMHLADEPSEELRTLSRTLIERDVPVVEIRLDGRLDLGAEFFRWEMATAVAGASLAVDPFDEPNVTESKDNTGRILDQFRKTRVLPTGIPRIAEADIGLFAEGPARNRIFTRKVAAALRTFFADRQPDDYLAILAYVDRNPDFVQRLEALRVLLRDRLRMPVLLGFGPRFLHSIGQLYKGGPAQGMFLQITAADLEDAPIPGEDFTFSQLKMAQALGDLESLTKRDKPALRLHLKRGAAEGLAVVRSLVEEALQP
jgi:glucose-6-phosphate isomerase